jgi:hypothetical protein
VLTRKWISSRFLELHFEWSCLIDIRSMNSDTYQSSSPLPNLHIHILNRQVHWSWHKAQVIAYINSVPYRWHCHGYESSETDDEQYWVRINTVVQNPTSAAPHGVRFKFPCDTTYASENYSHSCTAQLGYFYSATTNLGNYGSFKTIKTCNLNLSIL